MVFGMSRISLGRVHEMQWLGILGLALGRAQGAEEVPKPEGKLVIFEAIFTVGLRLSVHRFDVKILKRFETGLH